MKSQLVLLLSGPRRLIDKFSLVSALNTDLRGKKYTVGQAVGDLSPSSAGADAIVHEEGVTPEVFDSADDVSLSLRCEALVPSDETDASTREGDSVPELKQSTELLRVESEVILIDLTDDDVTVDETVVAARKPKRSINELEAARKLSEAELAEGFVDSDGEQVWVIEDIVAYAPQKGYKVKWLGWAEPTWNLAKDMPKGKRWAEEKMALARSQYHNAK